MPKASRHLALSTSAPAVSSVRAANGRFMPAIAPTRFGEYKLLEHIGAGSMAETFLASTRGNADFKRCLVIKRILPELAGNEQFVRMFIEEATLAAKLRHPNIVQTYDLGAVDGHYFMAMEYVDGRDLLTVLSACAHRGLGFPTVVALYIVMEILRGLHYAHRLRSPDGTRLSIVHRDLSPSNVLLSYEGEVKIGDFALAKAVTRERTQVGILKGKPGYISPEQARAGPIDHRADIFGIGILLYELITGQRLFSSQDEAAILDHAGASVIKPPLRHFRADLDEELEHIVQRTLDATPGARFDSCLALHDALQGYLARSNVIAGPFQLARFMRNLLGRDPREVSRRARVGLSPIDPLDGATTEEHGAVDDRYASRPVSDSPPDPLDFDIIVCGPADVNVPRSIEDAIPRHNELFHHVMLPKLEEQDRLEPSTIDAAPQFAVLRKSSRAGPASSLGWSFSQIGPPPVHPPVSPSTRSPRKRRVLPAASLVMAAVVFAPAPLHLESFRAEPQRDAPKEATNEPSSSSRHRADSPASETPAEVLTIPDQPEPNKIAKQPSDDDEKSTLLIHCPTPVDVQIHGLERRTNVRRLRHALSPGIYLIEFSRNGRRVGQIAVDLATNRRLTVACP